MSSVDLSGYAQEFCTEFNPYSFPSGFGFDAYTPSDVLSYLQDKTQWNFQFKKEAGRGILYGTIHTHLRRSVLNNLPQQKRLEIMEEKFRYYHVLPKLHLLFEDDTLAITDIQDIGMGHSVYKVDLASPSTTLTSIVIKQEEWPSQSFFSQVLKKTGFPTYHSGHVLDEKGCWEISTYLGDETAQKALLSNDTHKQETLITQLAEHAALGDVFGRGDRHFENYLFDHNSLYPIDVSFLFWEGNETWVKKYISGGMMEISALSIYLNQPTILKEAKKHFFNTYYITLNRLKKQEKLLTTLIENYFGKKEPDTPRKVKYIHSRLEEADAYFAAQKSRYLEAFQEMKLRLTYKKKLQNLATTSPELLEKNPRLKMYHLADQNRLSALYLLEDYPEILSLIK